LPEVVTAKEPADEREEGNDDEICSLVSYAGSAVDVNVQVFIFPGEDSTNGYNPSLPHDPASQAQLMIPNQQSLHW